MAKNNKTGQFRRFSKTENTLIEKIDKYHDTFYNQNTLTFEDNIDLTDQDKKDIFLFILEMSHKQPNNQYITKVESEIQTLHLSFEGKLQNYLNITVDDFERFKSNDKMFKVKYDNIIKARVQDSLKKAEEELLTGSGDAADTRQKIAGLKSVQEMINKDDKNISTSLPIKAYQAFHWDCLINDRDTLVNIIQDIVNNVILLRAKEMLNNTQLSDDGNEILINKDYNMPIEIIYNGDNIANECEIKNIEKIIYVTKKDITAPLNNAIIRLIASGKIQQRIVD